MGGDPRGVTIHTVFVSKTAGQVLLRYAGDPNMECWIIPSLNTSWGVMIISLASLVSMAALLAICVFIQKYWLLHGRRVNPNHPRLHGMSRRQVKALPSLIFTSVTDDNCTSETCAVCLEDYKCGEKLRVLPCCSLEPHKCCYRNGCLSFLILWACLGALAPTGCENHLTKMVFRKHRI